MKKIAQKLGKKKIIYMAAMAVLLIAAVACFIGIHSLSLILPSQHEAERWQGTSEKSYAQVSCFIPADETVTLSQIGAFREEMAKKLHEAALDIDNTDILTADAWSCVNKVSVSSALGSADVYATAVGGDFFAFHPITLISGSYITSSDLMQDRALLDEDTAWLLFGSTDIQGLTFRINGVQFTVAGVIEREQDFASRLAYTDGMGIFISYDAWSDLAAGTGIAAADTVPDESGGSSGSDVSSPGSSGIQCYEVVMPEPVKGYAQGVVKEKFPIGRGEIVTNTSRFELSSLWKLLKTAGTRSMQTRGVIYPYWENAARCVEDRAMLLLVLGIAALVLPVSTAAVLAVKYAAVGKRKLDDELIPRWKDSVQEAIRVRERARWEKKYGGAKKNVEKTENGQSAE